MKAARLSELVRTAVGAGILRPLLEVDRSKPALGVTLICDKVK